MKLCVILFFLASADAWIHSFSQSGRKSTILSMGISSTVKRVRDSVMSKERSREDLKLGIAGFYDRSSKLWEDVWGEVRNAKE